MNAPYNEWSDLMDEAANALDRHGRASTYNNDGCRCDRCTAAAREAKRQWRVKKRSTVPEGYMTDGPWRVV